MKHRVRRYFSISSNFYSVCRHLAAIAIYLLFAPSIALEGSEYFLLGIGRGGPTDSVNVSGDVGKIFSINQFANSFWAGIGVSYINSGEGAPKNARDYPIPHGNYRDRGVRTSDEWALWLRGGYEAFSIENAGRFLVSGIGGFSSSDESHYVQSNVTGWNYRQSRDRKYFALYGIGFSFLVRDGGVSLGVDFDNRRGTTLTIGSAW